MEKITLGIPAMYGDHHVMAVRTIFASLSGASVVYASAAFQQIAIAWEPSQISRQQIEDALTAQGYVPGQPVSVPQLPAAHHMEYVTAFGAAQDTVRFSVGAAPADGHPTPCPGFELRLVHGEHPGDLN
jgi:hypothetical protein